MDWVKRKGTTEKAEASAHVLAEEKFIFQRVILTVFYNHDTHTDLAINLYHTTLLYVSPRKYTIRL